MMTFTAKQFQTILDIVHKWYLQGFRDLLVNGQLALPYDFQRDAMRYVLKYCTKPEVMYYRARQDEQCRGIAHQHTLVLRSLHHHVTRTP